MSPLLGFAGEFGEIVITESYCNGSEKTLAECSRNVVGGNKCVIKDYGRAGVMCLSGNYYCLLL